MGANPHFYSNQSVATTAQITDAADHPHTGLIKALSVGLTGSYVVRGGADFDIAAASLNTISVATGVVFRDGIKQAVTSAITSASIVSTSPTAGATYALVVVNSLNAVVVKVTNTTNSIPEYAAGDIPIAIVLFTGVQSTMEVQYLTTNKANNGLDLGYADSGLYVSKGTLKATADGLFITGVANAAVAAADKILIQDASSNVIQSSTVSSIVALSPSLSGTTDNQVVTVSGALAMQGESGLLYDGTNLTVGGGLIVGPQSEFTLTESADDITLSNTKTSKKLGMSVKDSDGAAKVATFVASASTKEVQLLGIEEVIIVSLSDETTNLTTGTAKASFHMPYAMTLYAVKATVNTAPTGATIIVDINEAGATGLSTKLSIDAGEFTSTTAGTDAVINAAGASLANDALITFDIDQIGSSAAGKGLKVTLYGKRV